MAAAAPLLKIGEGFGTWLIPIILFGTLGLVAVVSLTVVVCVYSCRPSSMTEQEPETARYEIYRTPTIPYRDLSVDRPADSTIGRLVTHSRSLHVPRNQTINQHRLRPQVSSPELRNSSQPPPYTHIMPPVFPPRRNPRPQGRIYFDRIIVDSGNTSLFTQGSQRLPPSPENLPTQPERCFSISSPSSYSSFSQESLAPARALSWIAFSHPHYDSDTESDDHSTPTVSSNHNGTTVIPLFEHQGTRKLATARPRYPPGTVRSQSGRSGQDNRRLIIVGDNLVSGKPGAPLRFMKACPSGHI